jgi:galactokinase
MTQSKLTAKVPQNDAQAKAEIRRLAKASGLDVEGGRLRRTSSRFCLGVEHGDYNGTELFGVGTDRFIWLAFKPNGTDRIRLFSGNFADDGVIEFRSGATPAPQSPEIADTWARFPYGVDHILRKEGLRPEKGYDAVLIGNIPGGGMSRSASLTINLMLTALEVSRLKLGPDKMRIIDLAQAVENVYIGSPCGQLDQIMIYFAKAGMGTHYNPANRSIKYVPLGKKAIDFRIVSLDTGTVRPGLEKSTYKVRRGECDALAEMAGKEFGFKKLADVKDEKLCRAVLERFGKSHPDHCDRLTYIYGAQERFYKMLKAWRAGDIETVGAVFREDGIGLRDQYKISGPELETMCDIARSVPGVLGERMLGGGDKGASGALVKAAAVKALRKAVETGYPRSRPDYAGKFAVHECRVVDGVATMDL